ncbi:MAG: dockerin, partial [Hungateiclostridium thermocellum]|nr:dockerin [Acetivibrio thermocellus]
MKVKLKGTFLLLILIAVLLFNTVCSSAAESVLQDRTINDIVKRYQNNPFRINVSVSDIYEIEPKAEPPYVAGKLKSDYLKEALNCVNFMRYLVGLPNDLVLDDNYNNYAQHGTVLLARLRGIAHYPQKPGDMPDEFYNLAYKGTSSSSIAYGFSSLMDSIMAFMKDNNSELNLSTVGHRRWLLNPGMEKTGFGQCGRYYCTYILDSVMGASVKFDFIAWPARNYMPVEYFNDASVPWSVNLGSDYFSPSLNEVEVTLKRRSDNKVWIFNKDNIEEYGLFNVNNDYYGMTKCIIFRPKGIGSYNKNDVFDVNIKGIRLSTDGPTEINYTVRFFSLKDAIAERERNFTYGDLNGDGRVNSTDLAVMKRYLLKQVKIS